MGLRRIDGLVVCPCGFCVCYVDMMLLLLCISISVLGLLFVEKFTLQIDCLQLSLH